jgi:hypothetical protein
MSYRNLWRGLEVRLSHLRGELQATRKEVETVEAGVARLSELHPRIVALESAISAAETLLKHDHPDWHPERIKPLLPRVWKSPFKSGEIGRTALTVLREHGGWLRPLTVSMLMLKGIGEDPDDKVTREKLTNSVAAYFKDHEGDLVESRHEYAKEWRVIRPSFENEPPLSQ